MITKIEIDGFKTFRKFSMEFSPLTIIAGTNASGKSNLFDAFHLLSKLADSDLRTAFSAQRGDARELFTLYSDGQAAKEMHFAVEMLVNKHVKDNWGGEGSLKYTRLRYELSLMRSTNELGLEDLLVIKETLVNLKHQEDPWVKKHIPKNTLNDWRPPVPKGRRGKPYIYTEKNESGIVTIKLPQDGRAGGKETPANVVSQTVLSGVNSVDFPHVFAAKLEMLNWKFLQLNPESLRIPSQYMAPDKISEDGANLAKALNRIYQQDNYTLKEISRRLNALLPHLTEVQILDDKTGKQFIIQIKSSGGRWFSSRVLSEGTLRLLVLCVLLYDETNKGLICFEEPENGVHPSRIQEMVSLLRDLCVDFNDYESELRQMIVNTHSPILLGELIKYTGDRNVRTWFSQLVTQTMEVNDNKIQLQATRMLPVSTESQPELPILEKMGIADAQRFLLQIPRSEELIGGL